MKLNIENIKIPVWFIIIFNISLSISFAQVLITEESFDDESNGDITGIMSNGEPWEANTYGFCGPDNPGKWYVKDGSFMCNNVEGFNCCGCGPFGFGAPDCGDNKNIINFGPIDISSYQGLKFEFDISIDGDLECSSIGGDNCPNGDPYDGCIGGGNDQIVISYSIDGGGYEIFEYYCGENFCFQNDLPVCDLDANELNIRILMGTQQFQEFYYINSLNIYGYTSPLSNATVTPTEICEGSDAQLNENAGFAISWEWSGPGGFSSTLQNPVLTGINLSDAGIYTVIITDDNGCTSESSVEVIVLESPILSLSDNLAFCPGECFDINLNIQNGIEPYDATFQFIIGSTDVLTFTVDDYDTNNQMFICYSGDDEAFYDNIDNILYIPTDITGIGYLSLLNLIDGNGCETLTIVPTNMVILFKEVLNISLTDPLEVCDLNSDGTGDFDLSVLENDLKNGITDLSVNWFLDIDCINPINTPANYTSIPTTIYAFLTDPTNEKCNSDTIPVDLIVKTIPNVGEDNFDTFCGIAPSSINLEIYLDNNADAGGTWVNNDGIDITDPKNIDLSNQTIGTYIFYYQIENTPCDLVQASIVIEIVDKPNPGQNNEVYICNNGINTVQNLNDALGTHDLNGKWLDLDNSNVNLLKPDSVNFIGVKNDTFHFVYLISENSSCEKDSAIITVIVESIPFAGSDRIKNICVGSMDTFNLFNFLEQDVDSNGTWTQIGGTPIDISKPDSMNFYLEPIGIDSFLYELTGFCGIDSAYVFIDITASPNAGDDYNINVCQNEIINLFDSLVNYNEEGVWFDYNLDTIFQPESINLNELKIYTFLYVIPENGACNSDTAFATITTIQAPDAGTGNDFSICQNSTETINLFDYISGNSQIDGAWFDDSNNKISNPGSYDFSTYNIGAYSFQYILADNGFCSGDTTQLTITIDLAPFAGSDNNIEICNDVIDVDLTTLLGYHNNGGIWIDMDNSGVDIQSSAGTSISFEDLEKGIYQFQYKIEASNLCPETSAIITVEVNPVTYFNFEQEICDGQEILIGNGTYNLNNPFGTEIISNIYGCDSIIFIDLTSKKMEYAFGYKQESCFEGGELTIDTLSTDAFPVTIIIENYGEFIIDTFPYIIYDLPGNEYILNIIDNDNCKIVVNMPFTIARFTPYNININAIKSDNSYQLNVETDISPFSISWSSTNSLSCDDCLDPIATPRANEEYIITITDEEGCSVSDTIELEGIIDREAIEIDIPNIFTPDDDGYNDIFFAKSTNVNLKYSMYIYNRWGEKIFFSENINFNESQSGWNGWYNGKKLNPGVFVYMIIVDLENNEKEIRAGDIMLLK